LRRGESFRGYQQQTEEKIGGGRKGRGEKKRAKRGKYAGEDLRIHGDRKKGEPEIKSVVVRGVQVNTFKRSRPR